MKTTVSAILAAALLSACAGGTMTTPPQPYRAKGESAQIMISGRVNQTSAFFVQTDIAILANGTFAAGGEIGTTPETFVGSYDNLPVIADCSPVYNGYLYNYQCIVSINGERAAALTLTP